MLHVRRKLLLYVPVIVKKIFKIFLKRDLYYSSRIVCEIFKYLWRLQISYHYAVVTRSMLNSLCRCIMNFRRVSGTYMSLASIWYIMSYLVSCSFSKNVNHVVISSYLLQKINLCIVENISKNLSLHVCCEYMQRHFIEHFLKCPS